MASDEQFDIRAIHLDGQAVLAVAGEIDMAAHGPFLAAVDRVGPPGGRLVVDLGDVTFLDSSGLHALLLASEAQRAGGGDLVLRRPSAAVARILEITGLPSVLAVDHGAGPDRWDSVEV